MKNIALVTATIEDVFSNKLCLGAMKAAEELNENLFIFPVKYIDRQRKDLLSFPKQYDYEYQHNLMLNYTKSKSLDIILLPLSSIGYMATRERNLEILKSFGDIPVILISSEENNYISVMYDNSKGIIDSITFLVNKNKCKNIAIITGSLDNNEFEERINACKIGLELNGLKLDNNNILSNIYGNGYENDVGLFLLNHPHIDGIICGNDEIARSVYKALDNLNIEIGKDVYVVGFDDTDYTPYMSPPLSTIHADPVDLGYQSLYLAHKYLVNKFSPTRVNIKTTFIPRESVGVTSRNRQNEYTITNNFRHELTDVFKMNNYLSIVNRDLMLYNFNSFDNNHSWLKAFDIPILESIYVYTLDNPIVHFRGQEWTTPNTLILKEFKNSDELISDRTIIPFDNLFRNDYLPKERKTYTVIDIYVSETQYGFFLCDLPYDYLDCIEALCSQMSIAAKISEMIAYQQRLLLEKEMMLSKLEEERIVLDNISSLDELTGIYNRRGFRTKTREILNNSSNYNKKAYIICMDMDRLKTINDTFGHVQGDLAIKICAEGINNALSPYGIIGRMGGDEFLALVFSDENEEFIKTLIENSISTIRKEYINLFEVSVSCGILGFNISSSTPINNLIDEADKLLYLEKSKKKLREQTI